MQLNQVTGSGWPKGAEARAQQMWFDGFSSGMIASEFGLTRSAVMGMVHRRGWKRPAHALHRTKPQGRGGGRPKGSATKPKPLSEKRTSLNNFAGAHLFRRIKEPKAPRKVSLPTSPLPPGSEPVRLIDAKSGQCSWIIGETKGPDTLYCGAASGLASWCPYHRGVGWSKAA